MTGFVKDAIEIGNDFLAFLAETEAKRTFLGASSLYILAVTVYSIMITMGVEDIDDFNASPLDWGLSPKITRAAIAQRDVYWRELQIRNDMLQPRPRTGPQPNTVLAFDPGPRPLTLARCVTRGGWYDVGWTLNFRTRSWVPEIPREIAVLMDEGETCEIPTGPR